MKSLKEIIDEGKEKGYSNNLFKEFLTWVNGISSRVGIKLYFEDGIMAKWKNFNHEEAEKLIKKADNLNWYQKDELLKLIPLGTKGVKDKTKYISSRAVHLPIKPLKLKESYQPPRTIEKLKYATQVYPFAIKHPEADFATLYEKMLTLPLTAGVRPYEMTSSYVSVSPFYIGSVGHFSDKPPWKNFNRNKAIELLIKYKKIDAIMQAGKYWQNFPHKKILAHYRKDFVIYNNLKIEWGDEIIGGVKWTQNKIKQITKKSTHLPIKPLRLKEFVEYNNV
jgi:hypothetical protein